MLVRSVVLDMGYLCQMDCRGRTQTHTAHKQCVLHCLPSTGNGLFVRGLSAGRIESLLLVGDDVVNLLYAVFPKQDIASSLTVAKTMGHSARTRHRSLHRYWQSEIFAKLPTDSHKVYLPAPLPPTTTESKRRAAGYCSEKTGSR